MAKKSLIAAGVITAAGLLAAQNATAMDYQNLVRDPINYESMAESKHKRGIYELDSFKYTNTKGEENIIVMWDNGTFSMGLYPFNLKAFYEDEAMAPELNTIVKNKLAKWLKQSEQISQSTSQRKISAGTLERDIELSLGLPENHLRGTYSTSLPTGPGTSAGRQRLVDAIMQEDAQTILIDPSTGLSRINPDTGRPYEDWEIPYNPIAISRKSGYQLDGPIPPEREVARVYGQPEEKREIGQKFVIDVGETTPRQSTIEETLREVRAFQKAEAHPGQFGIRLEGLGGNYAEGQKEFRIGLGGSWEPVNFLGLNATAFAGGFSKGILSEVTGTPSLSGIYGYSIKEQEQPGFSGAIALDLKFGLKNIQLITGIGLDYKSWAEKTTVKTLNADGTTRKEIPPKIESKSEVSPELRFGLEAITNNGFGFGGVVTYNLKTKKPSFGGFASLRRTQNR